MKNITVYILIAVTVAYVLLQAHWLNKYNDQIKGLQDKNQELTVMKDSTTAIVVNTLSLTDSLEAENNRIQASKDSLQLYFNVIEDKLTKKEYEYKKLVNDTSNIYKLYRELTNILFTY